MRCCCAGMEGQLGGRPAPPTCAARHHPGRKVLELQAETGAAPVTPELPNGLDVAAIATWTREALQGAPSTHPIATQAQAICDLHRRQLAALPAPQGAQA